MKFTSFDGQNLFTQVLHSKSLKTATDNLNIVFIHGLGGDHCALIPLASKLMMKVPGNYYLYDLRGHGQSAKTYPATASSLEEIHTKDLKSFLQSQNIKNPILIGHCYGSLIIQEYLAQKLQPWPLKTVNISCLNSYPNVGINRNYWFKLLIHKKPPVKFQVRTVNDHLKYAGGPDLDIRRIYSDTKSAGGAFRWLNFFLAGLGWKRPLEILDQPTNQVILGKHDLFVNPTLNKKIVKKITHARLTLVDANHGAPLSIPQHIAQEISTFLNS